MTFYDQVMNWEQHTLAERVARMTATDVERALAASEIDPQAFLALLSASAEPYLEEMAQRAHALTVRNFGQVVLLFTPLYLANYCENSCLYCGFASRNAIKRDCLTLEEVEAEALAIAPTGLQHILILTGESHTRSSVDYIQKCTTVLANHFNSIAIEVYPLSGDDYSRLVATGVDGLTIFQETYDRKVYDVVHPRGPKRDYRFRLETPERACEAGVRSVNIGALLGLADWRGDVFMAGMHADYLQRRYRDVEVSLSPPRLRPHVGAFMTDHIVNDRHFVQAILALRLFLPRAGITLSTREEARFRDHLVPLGITKMSAGSSTQVGGRCHREADTGQFDISDDRDVPTVQVALQRMGYKAILKDWHCLASRDSEATLAGRTL